MFARLIMSVLISISLAACSGGLKTRITDLSSSDLSGPPEQNPPEQNPPEQTPPESDPVSDLPAPLRVLTADTSNYKTIIPTLIPGDLLKLKPGTYTPFTVTLNGQEDNWIVIESEDHNNPALIKGSSSANVLEIRSSSYLAIRNLKLDGLNNNASFGISAGGGDSKSSHHIRIENNEFVHFSGGQQQDAISTKSTAWNWIIRGNKIMDAGTGIYLGNSTGTYPFIAGVIENNFIQNTLGYNMEIKYQNSRPSLPGIPTSPQKTIIRNNVFMKADLPSPDGTRPNLLVGGFPDSGIGSDDMYEIYGNFFYDNPTGEPLLGVSGRVAIYNNVFVKGNYAAIQIKNHDKPLKLAHIFNNTIYGVPTGIMVTNPGSIESRIVGNLIFAATPIHGTPTVAQDNITDTVANAGLYVNNPSNALGVMDFFPINGSPALGSAMNMSAFSSYTDTDKDFNGTLRPDAQMRGCYAGEGTNPGWKLNQGIKD